MLTDLPQFLARQVQWGDFQPNELPPPHGHGVAAVCLGVFFFLHLACVNQISSVSSSEAWPTHSFCTSMTISLRRECVCVLFILIGRAIPV